METLAGGRITALREFPRGKPIRDRTRPTPITPRPRSPSHDITAKPLPSGRVLRTAGKAALVRCILQPAARAMSRHAASQIGILADIMTDPHASVDRGRGGCAGCSPEARIISVKF